MSSTWTTKSKRIMLYETLVAAYSTPNTLPPSLHGFGKIKSLRPIKKYPERALEASQLVPVDMC